MKRYSATSKKAQQWIREASKDNLFLCSIYDELGHFKQSESIYESTIKIARFIRVSEDILETPENEDEEDVDVLVIDAFSGDSVPIHLLTKEAFTHYFRHLKSDGILALHITNRFLNLRPVVKTAANAFDQDIKLVSVSASDTNVGYRSEWALVSKDKKSFQNIQFVRLL